MLRRLGTLKILVSFCYLGGAGCSSTALALSRCRFPLFLANCPFYELYAMCTKMRYSFAENSLRDGGGGDAHCNYGLR